MCTRNVNFTVSSIRRLIKALLRILSFEKQSIIKLVGWVRNENYKCTLQLVLASPYYDCPVFFFFLWQIGNLHPLNTCCHIGKLNTDTDMIVILKRDRGWHHQIQMGGLLWYLILNNEFMICYGRSEGVSFKVMIVIQIRTKNSSFSSRTYIEPFFRESYKSFWELRRNAITSSRLEKVSETETFAFYEYEY